MDYKLYRALTAIVWMLTAVAYVVSADDVLSYFLIDGTSFMTLVTGIATFYFGAELNISTRNHLRSKL